MVNYEIVGNSGQFYTFVTAPNSWKFRNSFRKFHAYRNLMFENAGVSKDEQGRYGKTIRPFLNKCHRKAEIIESPIHIGEPQSVTCADLEVMTGGEWTYSELAVVPLYTEDAVAMGDSTLKVADEFQLTICDTFEEGTSENKTSGSYESVGMIHAYNIDRMEVVTPSADVTIDGPQNPLAALIASGNQAAGEILELSKDLELEKPPYDLADSGDSVTASIATFDKVPTIGGVTRGSLFVPAGLLQIIPSTSDAFLLKVDIVAEVLCKDFA
jgi:hypothetical protein